MKELLDKENITEEDIRQLIYLKVEESIQLDFKQAESLGKNDKKKLEIAKDVSAFANLESKLGILSKSYNLLRKSISSMRP